MLFFMFIVINIAYMIALAGTGAIWAYYSTLIRPRATALFAVSVALVACNGWNIFRKWR